MQTVIMNLSDIDISDMIPPRKRKLKFYQDYKDNMGIEALIETNSIVVNQNNKIIDGYCTYVILSEQPNPKEKTSVLVSTSNSTKKIIRGRIIKKQNIAYSKEYEWKYELKSPVKPGDIVLSEVNDKIAKILVTEVITKDPSEVMCTKRAIKKYNKMLPA